MPSHRVLLRMLLILALCADGIVGAQAATRMMLRHVPAASAQAAGHDAHGTRAGIRALDRDDCNQNYGSAGQGAPRPGEPADHGCDCGTAACDCSCMLGFYAGRVPTPFGARQALGSVYLPPPVAPPLQRQISQLFRPPIG